MRIIEQNKTEAADTAIWDWFPRQISNVYNVDQQSTKRPTLNVDEYHFDSTYSAKISFVVFSNCR